MPKYSLDLFFETEDHFEDKKQHIEKRLKKQLSKIVHAKDRLTREWESASQWESVQQEAMLLQSNLFKIKRGMHKITLPNWFLDQAEVEIRLDPTLTPAEEVSKRFKKSKKFKRALEPLKRQMEKMDELREKISLQLDALRSIQSIHDLHLFCEKHQLSPTQKTPSRRKEDVPSLPYREFITEDGHQLWVGKSAKGNDQLTFTYAHGSDYWLHARDVPGSHVVLHLGKGREPSEGSVKDALQAALYYSKARDQQEGEVCLTQCKYVSRYGKNQPGKVQISQHRVVFTKMDKDRIKKLRERKKP